MSDNRSITEKLKDELVPSIFSGAIGVLASSFILGVDLNLDISVGSMNMPLWSIVGGVITSADLLAYASHDYILEKIPQLQNISSVENKIGAPILTGLASYGLFKSGISSDVSFTNSFLLGAGSSVGGRYTASMILDPKTLY
jgi:hypothetical protein